MDSCYQIVGLSLGLKKKAYIVSDIISADPDILERVEKAIRKHIDDFVRENKLKPESGGSEARLDSEQTSKLLAHLDEQIYVDGKDICDYVWSQFDVAYSRSGMTQWLGRNGVSYHKPAPVPAKADKAKQEAFITFYENLKKTLSDNEKIVFMDGVHPTHQTRMADGWIRRGTRKEVPTISG